MKAKVKYEIDKGYSIKLEKCSLFDILKIINLFEDSEIKYKVDKENSDVIENYLSTKKQNYELVNIDKE